jgi:hypothetical protein
MPFEPFSVGIESRAVVEEHPLAQGAGPDGHARAVHQEYYGGVVGSTAGISTAEGKYGSAGGRF